MPRKSTKLSTGFDVAAELAREAKTTTNGRRIRKTKEPLVTPTAAISWKPHAYQLRALKFLVSRACAGLFLDPGLGKTSITLGALSVLKEKGLFNRALVLAPLRVCHAVWPEEVKKWKEFNNLKVVVLHGPRKDELLEEDADIYVMNYEGLDWLTGATIKRGWTGKESTVYTLENFDKIRPDVLVVDESSKTKRVTTARFKALKTILPKFSRRYILTGTPAPNGLLDLFGQTYVLDEGRSLGSFITRYKMEYFLPLDRNGWQWAIKPGAEERIYEKLRPLVMRLAAEDYLELPELIENIIRVDLPPKARKVYDDLETEALAELEDGTKVMAMSAGAATIKLRQCSGGGLYDGKDEGSWTHLHDAKTEALVDLVDELQGSPLLVAYEFKHDLARIQKALGKDIPFIGGGTKPAEMNEIIRKWNAGQIPVLLGHPASMGHGLNLQGAGQHVCWYGLTYDFELYDQFIRRVLRQGNTHKSVTVHHIVARGTVDEAILRALRRKEKNQGALLAALKEYRREKR